MVRSAIRGVGELCRRLGSLAPAREGNAPVEFAFIVPVILLLALGTYDAARYALLHQKVVSAARAGAQYGAFDQSFAGDLAGMEDAALDDAGPGAADVTVTARRYCRCPGDTTTMTCDAVCADGEFALMYVEVAASAQMSTFLDYPWADNPLRTGARSVVRAR
jgi:Flp pilus assembly protein TadG